LTGVAGDGLSARGTDQLERSAFPLFNSHHVSFLEYERNLFRYSPSAGHFAVPRGMTASMRILWNSFLKHRIHFEDVAVMRIHDGESALLADVDHSGVFL
jgi:hypothetical protein